VQRSGTIAIAGRPNVGKSTFLNAALGQPISIVSPVPQTTRHGVLGVVRRHGDELILVDTPGIHRPLSQLGKALNRTARAVSEQADVVVFVTDVPRPRPEPNASRRRADAADGKGRTADKDLVHPGDRTLLADIGSGAPTILVVNKIDKLHDKSRLLPLLQALSTIRDFVSIVPVSALREDGVDRVLDEASTHLPERPPRFEEDTLTDLPSRFFAGEFVREQILLSARNEVPHACAVQVQRFEQLREGGATHIDALIIVEREGQKKILIGKGGSMLKTIGTQARERIEQLLGAHVQLSLWVQVNPGWTESRQALAELGYESPRQT
jgi:GTPase